MGCDQSQRHERCMCDADCSLREAVAAASASPGADMITFNMGVGSGFVQSPINLTLGEIVINGDLTINGPGAAMLTVQRSTAVGTPNFRIFTVPEVTAAINGLTIANG